ncbi:MAG: hypothetical protein KKD48_01030 [Nanoarchaeota archaeon]|nr:hypothetical protein [Nanoarchaeota archaeon]
MAIISEEGTLYILLVILGVSIGNLYGLKLIFRLEKKIALLEQAIKMSLKKKR